MVARYEIESVEGVGYLLFSIAENGKQQRIGDIFQSVSQAKSAVPATHAQKIQLVQHSAYGEMVNLPEESFQPMRFSINNSA